MELKYSFSVIFHLFSPMHIPSLPNTKNLLSSSLASVNARGKVSHRGPGRTLGRLVQCCITSDICAAVLPLAPSITIARAEEMLKGEKKTFAPLS